MKILILNALLILISFCQGCKKDSGEKKLLTIEDAIVQSNEITGWVSGNGWYANNSSDLTKHINGGSVLFLKYGFKEAVSQIYSGSVNGAGTDITLCIYDLTIVDNVNYILEDPSLELSSAQLWTDQPAGTKAKYRRLSESQILHFSRDKYYVSISIENDSDESLSILKQFAYNVDGKVKKLLK